MKKNNKTNKKQKILKISIILIVVFLIGYLLITFCTPTGKAYRTVKYINSAKVKSEVMPIGNTSYWYSEYKGNIDSSVVDKSVYYFANTLVPEYYKIENTEEYYKKHRKEIKILLGITEYNEFNDLVGNIKKLNGEPLKFEKYFIVKKSTKVDENSITTVVAIQYEENEVLLVSLEISNKIDKKKKQ